MISNNEISYRQLKRMLMIEGFGAAGITWPAIAVRKNMFSEGTSELPGSDWGNAGLWGVVCAGLFFVVFTALLLWIAHGIKDQKIKQNTIWKNRGFCKVLCTVVLLRFFVNGTFLMGFFGKTLQEIYLPKMSIAGILFPVVLFLWISSFVTIQKRGRFMELLFSWIVFAFLLMVILSITSLCGKLPGFFPSVPKLSFRAQDILSGYDLLLCASPLEFLIFLHPVCVWQLWKGEERHGGAEPKTNPDKTVWKAVLGIFLGNVILWVLTVGIIGAIQTGETLWPVVKMMQTLKMPGGFFQRFDMILVVYWIFSMAGILSGYLFYGKYIGEKVFGREGGLSGKKSIWIAGFVLLLSYLLNLIEYDAGRVLRYFILYKRWIDFPLLIIIPLLYLWRYARPFSSTEKRSFRDPVQDFFRKFLKKVGIVITIMVVISLNGCTNTRNVEEKNYILSLYVDYSENSFQYWCAKAKLTSPDEKEELNTCEVVKIEGLNLEELDEKYKKLYPGELEWNHIETIFLNDRVAYDKNKLKTFLSQWNASWQRSPGVIVVHTPEMPEALYKAKGIVEGAAGQEVALLMEEKEGERCQTPLEMINYMERKGELPPLYQIHKKDEKLTITD